MYTPSVSPGIVEVYRLAKRVFCSLKHTDPGTLASTLGCSFLHKNSFVNFHTTVHLSSLIPRPSHLQFLIACIMQKRSQNGCSVFFLYSERSKTSVPPLVFDGLWYTGLGKRLTLRSPFCWWIIRVPKDYTWKILQMLWTPIKWRAFTNTGRHLSTPYRVTSW